MIEWIYVCLIMSFKRDCFLIIMFEVINERQIIACRYLII